MGSLLKYDKFGWQAQASKGSEADGASVNWVPLADETSFDWDPGATELEQGDRDHYETVIYPTGHRWEGGVSINLVPGVVSALLGSSGWLMSRDSDNQGTWATVWLCEKHKVRTAMDVKISTLELVLERGGPVRCNLDLRGIGDGSNLIPTGYATAMDMGSAGAPFIFKEVTITTCAQGGALGSTSDVEGMTVTFDGRVESADDGMRLNASFWPYQLYNLGTVGVTGHIDRDRVDSTWWDSFREMYGATDSDLGAAAKDWYEESEDVWKVLIARGATSIGIQLNRCRIMSLSGGIGASHVGRHSEGIDFTVLGALDGSPGPLTLT